MIGMGLPRAVPGPHRARAEQGPTANARGLIEEPVGIS